MSQNGIETSPLNNVRKPCLALCSANTRAEGANRPHAQSPSRGSSLETAYELVPVDEGQGVEWLPGACRFSSRQRLPDLNKGARSQACDATLWLLKSSIAPRSDDRRRAEKAIKRPM